MSQDVCHDDLQEKTQQLLQGPLKHAKAAALAAALLPLASVAASPAAAQVCGSAGNACGVVWNDANQNGIQDAGEPGVSGAVVTLGDLVTATDGNGFYSFFVDPGDYQVAVQIPPATQPSPPNAGSDDTVDSDGEPDGFGNSVATVTVRDGEHAETDFGFFASPVAQPGTGTPGYWKNHPEAWPVASITIGGVSYTKAQALAWLDNVTKDKRTTMFSSLLSAKLNVLVGNESSCVSSTIAAADAWMATYGPMGSGSSVHASSLAWKVGEPLHRQMDNYNNGMLCAPHRD
jgi:hypothetical protein